MKKIEVMKGYVLLKKYQFPKPESAIILPESNREEQEFYEVVSRHDGLAFGDIVVIAPYKFQKVLIDDEVFYLVKPEDVVAHILGF